MARSNNRRSFDVNEFVSNYITAAVNCGGGYINSKVVLYVLNRLKNLYNDMRVERLYITATYKQIGRELQLDYRTVKRSIDGLSSLGLLEVHTENRWKIIGLTFGNSSECILPTFNVGNKEKRENNKDTSPATPLQKRKKEKKEKAASSQKILTSFDKKQIGTPSFSASLDERKEAFGLAIQPYVQRFGRAMCLDFFYYWSEPSQSGERMKFELEKTWDLARRLTYWQRNADKWAKKKATQPQSDKSAERAEEREKREQERETRERESVPIWAYRKLQKMSVDVGSMSARQVFDYLCSNLNRRDYTEDEWQGFCKWTERMQMA